MFLSGQTANWVSHTCGAEKEIKKNPAQSKNIFEVNVGVKNTIVQKDMMYDYEVYSERTGVWRKLIGNQLVFPHMSALKPYFYSGKYIFPLQIAIKMGKNCIYKCDFFLLQSVMEKWL